MTLLYCLLTALPIGAVPENSACPTVQLQVVRLPDLQVARGGHSTFCANGEVVVIGGHTTGFVPTATAEYYADGKWHLLKTVYAHDQGFFIPLKSGKVMIGGGHEQHLGIGQIFATEFYDPKTHSFEGWGCLDKKRCMAGAVELDSGKVYITGNWYNDDSWELYNGAVNNTSVKTVATERSYPYVFRTARDNAIVFGSADIHGNPLDTISVDQLKGEALSTPLFDTWRPLRHVNQYDAASSFIGDDAKGIYAYLMLAQNKSGQYAIIKVENGDFTVLPTKFPIPSKSKWGKITYFTPVITDPKRHRAYAVGHDDKQRFYILYISLQTSPAPLTFYYTDPLPDIGLSMPVLTPDGNLVMAGGTKESNFNPYSSAVLLPLGDSPEPVSAISPWLWLLFGTVIVLICDAAAYRLYGSDRNNGNAQLQKNSKNTKLATLSDGLMERIEALMTEERPYLRSDLKVADVADLLGVSSRVVSDCIKTHRNTSFSPFVNEFRITYAQKLLYSQPEMKLSAVCLECGFANETSFFRTFKIHTGMTPREWVLQNSQLKD